MAHEVLLPGITGFDMQPPSGVPIISDAYRDTLSRLVLFQDRGVTHFYGCELDLGPDAKVWMSPVEVDDGKDFSYFQLLYVNTTPQEALGNLEIPVSHLEVDEASYKLTAADHPGYQQLMGQFTDDRKHVLVRYCNTGSAYYPRSLVPTAEEKPKAKEHLEKLIAATGLHEPEVKVELSKPSEKENEDVETHLIQAVHARRYPFSGGEVHSYGLVLGDDPWQYYEIYTPNKLERIEGKDLLIRIDSGCDSGQIYDDRGCDCREQLHTALTDIQEVGNGAVIHIPAQDGRGYGAAVKMETEGLKRAIKVATNQDDPQALDTITAARTILGEGFDIRTYDGVGRLLGMLGVESVLLQTDNKLKAEALVAAGINVSRKPTNTVGSNGCSRHIKAKHEHGGTYYKSEEV